MRPAAVNSLCRRDVATEFLAGAPVYPFPECRRRALVLALALFKRPFSHITDVKFFCAASSKFTRHTKPLFAVFANVTVTAKNEQKSYRFLYSLIRRRAFNFIERRRKLKNFLPLFSVT
jgi:hypothetical protein